MCTWTWGTVWPASAPFWTEIVDESLFRDHPRTELEPVTFCWLMATSCYQPVFVRKIHEKVCKNETRAHEKPILQLSRLSEQFEKDLRLLLASDLQKAAQLESVKQEHVQEEQASDWQRQNFWRSRRKCNSTESWYFLRKVWTCKKHSEAIFCWTEACFFIAIIQKYRRLVWRKLYFLTCKLRCEGW